MTRLDHTDRSHRPAGRLGIAWLALGLPVGALIGWLARISDHEGDRRYGTFLLVLAALSVVLGVALVQAYRPWLRATSLALSGAWFVAAGVAFAVADFVTDKLWGGGLTGLVAVVTAALALRIPSRD
ncbi:MAG: hypothetical protein ACRDV2_00935 [Actinomycetes bacterium]